MKIHIVQKGETIGEIANQYQSTVEELAKVNPQLANPNHPLPGMKLSIPIDNELVSKADTKQGTVKSLVDRQATQARQVPASGAYMHCSHCNRLMMVERPIYLSSQNEPPHAMTRHKWF